MTDANCYAQSDVETYHITLSLLLRRSRNQQSLEKQWKVELRWTIFVALRKP